MLFAWWAATASGLVEPIFLPAPGDVLHAARLTLLRGDLVGDVLVSARRVFLGFGLAACIAVPLGIVMGVWRPAKAIMDPFVSLLRPLPSITWIPLSTLWLGIGEAQKVAIVFMGSRIYMMLYTVESTRRIDPLLLRAARNLGAGDLAIMREVILPGSLPGIIAGLKVVMGAIGAVTGALNDALRPFGVVADSHPLTPSAVQAIIGVRTSLEPIKDEPGVRKPG